MLARMSFRSSSALVLLLLAQLVLSGCDDPSFAGVDATTDRPDGGGTVADTGVEPEDSGRSPEDGGRSPEDGGPSPERLGASCEQDSDCDVAGRCIRDTDTHPVLGGGPIGGYCTKDCTADANCGAQGVCVADPTGANALCLATCRDAEGIFSLDQDLDPNRCRGREDLSCVEINERLTCAPTCSVDAQCPEGRRCDFTSGACVDGPPLAGDPIGTACDPAASTCAGGCLSFGDPADPDFSVCSAACVLGGVLDGLECGGFDEGICLFTREEDPAPGDRGYCTRSCTTHGDCAGPNFWCQPFGLPTHGLCYGGSADCSTAPCEREGETCTVTRHGSFCLSPMFPLGTAAP